MLKCRNFISKFNLVTGKTEWHMLDDFYEYKKEIRSSGYADMLNDNDRNSKYYNALRKVINDLKQCGQRIHVLDIGCGSGILSMMALQLGADKVTACESFEPMYKCARRVFKENGLLTEKVEIINSSSLNLKIGYNMSERANVLVSEIFDSELIGEGVLPVFEHAVRNLLTEDATIIPHSARLFLQPVSSQLLRDHNRIKESKYIPSVPKAFSDCKGYGSGFELQASALVCDRSFRVLSPATVVKEIDFKTLCSLDSDVFLESGTDAAVLWWQLVMTAPTDEGIIEDGDCISTAPRWAHKHEDDYRWRDHWLQVVLFPPTSNTTTVTLMHDQYSLWLAEASPHPNTTDERPPLCTCGLHAHIPRSRLCQLNSGEYAAQIDLMVRLVVAAGVKTAVVLSDFSLLPLALVEAGVASVVIVTESAAMTHLTQTILASLDTRLSLRISVASPADIAMTTADAVLADPHFLCSLEPWDDMHLWFLLDGVPVQPSAIICPRKMVLRALLVSFERLQAVANAVGTVAGFSLAAFDRLVRDDGPGPHFEPRHLWEYEGTACSEVGTLLTVDMATASPQKMLARGLRRLCGRLRLAGPNAGAANGVVVWAAWEVADGVWVDPCLAGVHSQTAAVHWRPASRQAVHILGDRAGDGGVTLACAIDLETGEVSFEMEA